MATDPMRGRTVNMTDYTTNVDPLYRYCSAEIPVAGTGQDLVYNCRRTIGRSAGRKLELSLTSDNPPEFLEEIEVLTEVAGQANTTTYQPQPNLTHEYVWDGRDGYGNPTNGAHPVDVEITYKWQGSYGVPEDQVKSFAASSDQSYSDIQSRADGTSVTTIDGRARNLFLTTLDFRREGFGGWSLSSNHRYDATQGVLYRGDGNSRSVRTSILEPTISVAAGKDPDEKLKNPAGITLTPDESVLVADHGQLMVRKFQQNGASTTLIGTIYGKQGPRLNRAGAVSLGGVSCARRGPDGDVYVAESDRHIIRKYRSDRAVELVAGTAGQSGFQTEEVVTENAQFSNPTSIAFDDEGALLVTDTANAAVRRVEPDGTTTRVAGTGEEGYSGDGGPATEGKLHLPQWITAGPNGGFYVADSNNNAIRRFEVGGNITTVAGGNGSGSAGDGGQAVDAKLSNPLGVDVEPDGTFYVAESGSHRVRKVDSDGTISTIAGGNGGGYTGNGGPAADAKLKNPSGVAVAEDGSIYVSEWGNNVVRRITADGTIEFFNGWRPESERETASERPLAKRGRGPRYVAIASDGTIYYVRESTSGPAVKRVTPDGEIEPFAGGNGRGYAGDGGPATDAKFSFIEDLHVGTDGHVYVVDTEANVVRKIDDSGIITTVAGNGERPGAEQEGEGGPATDAPIEPSTVTTTPSGDLYVVDSALRVVWRVDNSGTISVHLGGEDQQYGSTLGDFFYPPGFDIIDTDAKGNLYVLTNQGLVMTERSDGVLRYVTAPVDRNAYPEGNGPERFPTPGAMTVASDGTLFLGSDSNVYRVTTADQVSRIAGIGRVSIVGGDGPAKRAGLRGTSDFTMGPEGQLYIPEGGTGVVRKINVRLTDQAADIVPSRDGTEFYEFDTSGYHTRTFNAQTGEVTAEFSYDYAGLLTEITDVDGQTTTIERSADGNPTAIVSPNGQRTELSVDTDGYLTGVTDPDGESASLSYGSGGLLTEYTAPSGRSVQFGYDEVGKLDSATTGSGTTTFTESENGSVRTVTHETPKGRITTHEFDHDGGVTLTTTFPSGATRVLVEREDGSKTMTMRRGAIVDQQPLEPDPRFGEAASYVADETRQTPGGLEATFDVSRSARMTNSKDPRTVERLVETDAMNGRTRKTVADATQNTLTTTTPAGRSQTVQTDAAGRIQSLEPDGLATLSYAYDDTGRVETVSWGSGADEREYTLSYTDGFLTSVTNPTGDELSFTRNAAGDVTEATLPNGRTITYTLDGEGRLQSMTSPGGSTTELSYDASGNLDAITLPDDSTTDFTIDQDDNLQTVSYPGGETLSYSYDSAGRPEKMDLGHGSTTFTWDDSTDLPSKVDSADGVSLALTYDGSLLTEREWSGPVSGTIERTFDDSFRLASRTVAGNEVTFDYDDDDQRTTAGDLSITRNPDTGLVDESTLDGTTESWTHTQFGTVDTHTFSAGGSTLYDADYTYDGRGFVTELEETVDGTTTTREFTYDESGRLTKVTVDGSVTQEFGYDDDSNRTSHTRNGSTVSPSYDDRNRLSSYGTRSYSYTAAGHLESVTENGGTTTYDYDVRHNLRSVTKPDGTTIEYLHDGFDRRVGKRVDGTLTRMWLYRDGLNPVAELDGNGNVRAQFVYGTREYVPDYVIRDGTTYRLVTDHLGSPRLVVDTGSGTVEQRIDYDAFGRVQTDTNPGFQPFGFAGGLYDPDTGLVRQGARDYDPQAGQWTTPDPLYMAGGSANRYAYAGNNPQSITDRWGLAVVSSVLIGMAAGAAVGAAFDMGMQAATKGAGNINYTQTAVSAGVGAVTGGAGGAVSSAGWSTTATVAANAGIGATGGAAEQVGKNYAKGRCNKWKGVGKAATVGGVTGGALDAAPTSVFGDDAIDSAANKVSKYNDMLGEAGDAATSQAMKPHMMKATDNVASGLAGKSSGTAINSATSSPSGASK